MATVQRGTLLAGASFSECGRYRYALWRKWADGPLAAFCGLNPSTADEFRNDRTVNRCIHFARKWNYAGLIMLNAFAYRATDPADMKRRVDPVGRDNDLTIKVAAGSTQVEIVVCCWGNHVSYIGRGVEMLELLKPYAAKLRCLAVNGGGEPKHPLYCRGDMEPLPFEIPA